MADWARDAVFYHLFPLGLCDAPRQNDFNAAPQARLGRLVPWLDHAKELGASAVLLGPVLESGSHGYDTVDLFQVDRRLGQREDMMALAGEARQRGLRLVMDGVFNHVGRGFWAFRDVLAHGRDSRFRDWFHLDFHRRNDQGDPFSYATWNGCQDLVKLNLANPEVKSHLFEATASWLRDFQISGLRLDAADHIELAFLKELSAYCRRLDPEFWLMGEVVHGDYQNWLKGGGLDSVTNYECYKGIYSSHLDANYFEIAHSLRRQAGNYGLYRGHSLYNFLDNHDVDRLASKLKDQAHLFPCHCLLFTMPGAPSVYYGSEFGIKGVKAAGHDWTLRPALNLAELRRDQAGRELCQAVARLAHLRAACPALRRGDYEELALSSLSLVFSRRAPGQWLVVAISAEKEPAARDLQLPQPVNGRLVDLLNPGQEFPLRGGRARIDPLWPCWARVLQVEEEA